MDEISLTIQLVDGEAIEGDLPPGSVEDAKERLLRGLKKGDPVALSLPDGAYVIPAGSILWVRVTSPASQATKRED